jgi:hypothetical protein
MYSDAVREGTKLFGENMFGIHSIEYDVSWDGSSYTPRR